MTKLKLLGLMLVFVMIFNIFAGTAVYATDNKVFINEDNETYAKILDSFGIYSFYSDDGAFFNDLNGVKRAEAAKALISLLGYEGGSGSVSHLFIDVPDYHEYVGEISGAVSLGLMRGTGPGVFEPDGVIKLEHFIKSLVIALGYDYKAEYLGGYPTGYVNVAGELELLEGVELSLNDDLSREALVRILYNSLEVEIPVFDEMTTEYTQYETREGHTVLTEYHDICNDKAVVQTSDIITLNSYYEPSNEKVVIGNDTFIVGDMKDIFSYVGHEVKYYYKLAEDEKTLVWFEETSNNNVYSFMGYDVAGVEANKISFYKENGKTVSLSISDGANVFYNGEIVTSGVTDVLENFADNITLLSNDNDKTIDVVFIEDYNYDMIDFVNIDEQKIYMTDNVINYAEKELISVKDANGAKITVEELIPGTVVGFSDISGEILMMSVVGSPVSTKVAVVSDDKIITDDGTAYRLHKRLNPEAAYCLKVGKLVRIVANSNGEIVWAGQEEDAMKVGYLIKCLSAQKTFDSMARCDILGTNGIVTQYMLEEEIRVDGNKMKREDVKAYLMQVKQNQNTVVDGDTAQLVYYKTNDEGVLTDIQTTNYNEEKAPKLVYNHNERGNVWLRDNGYGAGVFAGAYAATKEVPVFKIPAENIETYDERYFQVINYGTAGAFKDGGTYALDIYKGDLTEIMPIAMVMYGAFAGEIPANAELFLVENVVQALNSEEVPATKLEGYYNGERRELFVDTEVSNIPALSPGDVCVFALDLQDTIISIEKVYDFETDTVDTEVLDGRYLPVESNGTMREGIIVLHIYNAPANSRFIEAFKTDFSLGIPGDDKKVLVNTGYGIAAQGASGCTYDANTETGKVGNPDRIIDYLHDKNHYDRVLIRYGSGYAMDTIYYRLEN